MGAAIKLIKRVHSHFHSQYVVICREDEFLSGDCLYILCVFFEVTLGNFNVSRLTCTALKSRCAIKHCYICNDCDISGFTHCHFVNGAAKSNKNF